MAGLSSLVSSRDTLSQSTLWRSTGTRIAFSSDKHSFRVISLHYLTISVPALDGEWELRPSGWVVNQADEHLVWVPLHPQVPLSCPSRLGIVGPQGSSCMMISYNDMFLGDSWSRCYVGE